MKPTTTKIDKLKRLIKYSLLVLILLGLGAGCFFAGAYLELIDIPALVEKYDLYEYPVFNRYFTRPAINFEPVDIPADEPAVPSPVPAASVLPPATESALEKQQRDSAELAKQLKLEQQAKAKQIAKLARLYNSMRAPEAAAILSKLDDITVLAILNKMDEDQAAKVLATFDAERAASLTQAMLKSRTNNNVNPNI